MLARFMEETWIVGNGIALAYSGHRQGFVEREEFKHLLEYEWLYDKNTRIKVIATRSKENEL
ncbi:MAG: hypothetical protein GZ094_11495 [Mariniphaga sp.]|nr:hypothetical protein [Mariniphaga sp.]